MREANRLNQIKEYYFSAKLKELAKMQRNGKEIINLGVGSPDLPPPPQVITALCEALKNPKAHQYQPYKGTDKFRNSVGDFYKNHFNVNLNPDTEILPLIGSKEGISHISSAFLNKGDEVLIPNPGYPTYTSVTRLMEAEPVYYELDEANDWLPNLEKLEQKELQKVKIMWINYPHMPTGATGNKELFQKLIVFAKKHEILLVNDNPYSFILNGAPNSLLAIEGAKEVAMELNSLSKSFNMSGWRVGTLCGSEANINSVLKVKTNIDSGMFFPVMAGATEALKLPGSWFKKQNEIYEGRKQLMLKLIFNLNCKLTKNQAGMFIWAKIPTGISSEDFVEELIHDYGIFAAPGFIFGSKGEGYIRFSLCAPEEIIKMAIKKTEAVKLA
ncbi:MAG TPA: aminotransferase class I/II-fold pyridoxal phosphate-dependent enzyme [Salinimicrobium sp.]|nr:aminotransferase class I/II-fold pyridoxal phosphate-dependent enzyme [Salinimicrobium sp.]